MALLDDNERAVVHHLAEAWNHYVKLESVHDDNDTEFRLAIHRANHIVMARPVQREFDNEEKQLELEEQQEIILSYIAVERGLGGRTRKASSNHKRMVDSVSKCIRSDIDKIKETIIIVITPLNRTPPRQRCNICTDIGEGVASIISEYF